MPRETFRLTASSKGNYGVTDKKELQKGDKNSCNLTAIVIFYYGSECKNRKR